MQLAENPNNKAKSFGSLGGLRFNNGYPLFTSGNPAWTKNLSSKKQEDVFMNIVFDLEASTGKMLLLCVILVKSASFAVMIRVISLSKDGYHILKSDK